MDELLKEIIHELRELNKKIDSLNSGPAESNELITLETFCERMDIQISKAREIAGRRDLCEKGISVTMNGDKRGGKRIHWQKYLEYIGACPAVPESKRVSSRTRAI